MIRLSLEVEDLTSWCGADVNCCEMEEKQYREATGNVFAAATSFLLFDYGTICLFCHAPLVCHCVS